MLMLSFPFTVHREHRRLDDRGDRAPAVAVYGLHAHERRALPRQVRARRHGLFTLLGFSGLYLLLGILYSCSSCGSSTQGPEDAARMTATPGDPAGRRSLMETIWFCLLAVMVTVYVVLDGFDFGVGSCT